MSLNDILGSALSGLGASQSGLRTVSANIANVNTPGYARERVSLSTGVTSGRVSGVVVSEPDRVADRFLEATVYRRSGEMGRAEITSSYLDRLQSMLGTPGAPSGLSARLDAITSAAVAMTGSPGSEQTLAAFTQQIGDAISTMQQLDSDVASLRADVETEVGHTIETANGLLKRIHELNDTVAQLNGLGRSSAGAADQRMTALEDLSKLMNVTVREQPDGRVTIDTASGAVLLDRRLRQLSYPVVGQGVAQPTYPPIDIRFADGASTGERIDSAGVGGKLGGLIDLRDRALPQFADQVGVLFGGLAETLNAAANEGTSVPAPASLEGRQTGLIGTDRLGFTGQATFAVLDAGGKVVAKTDVDFSTVSPPTIDGAVARINAGLGGAGTASFVNGKLTISANGSGNGIAIGQDPAQPSDRAGAGFSHFFGLNDIVRSDDSALVPSGLQLGDPHGFTSGQTTQLVLRDASGRSLVRYTLSPASGGTVGDLVNDLNNNSPLKDYGSFSLDDRGRFQFKPDAALSGASLSIPADSTDRFGTGRSFSALAGLTGASSGLSRAEVLPVLVGTPRRLPLARLDTTALPGEKAVGAGDVRGATAFVNKLAKPTDFGKDGSSTIERFASGVLGRAATQAAQAEASMTDATARRDDAANRRDSFSGVNIDEELAQLIVFQNSYSASARVMTTATQMYDTLIAMVG
ncbi:flagellar hook-associated protein FlgK [Novosphingobium sp. M1R2S20]|uniref:Flagellar hook-associated protein 1 n=1 Tax=Novosphingobium rhizovicinum TaxID=3228928 RepID=A0ABV3R9B8_9SPHN